MEINHRQASILYELIQSDTPLTAGMLAAKLDLNERVVRFNLPPLDLWLQAYGVKTSLQTPKGIFLDMPQGGRQRLLQLIPDPLDEKVRIFLRSEYRQLWIALKVLESIKPLHSKDFEKELELSENTLARDFQGVRKLLEKHTLTLIRKRSVGTYVEGSEIQIRYALSILLKRILGDANIVHLYLWKKVELQNPWTERSLLRRMALNVIESWPLLDSWDAIQQLTSSLGVTYDEVNISRIALYLAITIVRIRNSKSVSYPEERMENIRGNEIFKATRKVLTAPSFTPDISFSDAEIVYLFNQLVTYGYAGFGDEYAHLEDVRLESFLKIAEDILRAVFDAKGMEYITSPVTTELATHLHRCYHLLHIGVKVHFNLADDVQISYPELFEDITRITQKISTNPLFNTILEEETARITLYAAMAILQSQTAGSGQDSKIAVVCPTGGVTSRMLMLRLRTELPELGNLELMSIRQLRVDNLENVRAIISTTETISKDLGVPVLIVNPLLKDDDISRLKSWLISRE
jgi:transcriptional antiterminator